MPSKGKRIASKQSTSSHKKKRTRGPSGIPLEQSVIQSERTTMASPPETRMGSEVEQSQVIRLEQNQDPEVVSIIS